MSGIATSNTVPLGKLYTRDGSVTALPLDKASEAHAALETGTSHSKIVLLP